MISRVSIAVFGLLFIFAIDGVSGDVLEVPEGDRRQKSHSTMVTTKGRITTTLLPKPVSRRFTQGVFALNSGTVVVAGESDMEFELCRYLEKYLYAAFADSWRFTTSKNHNTIELFLSAEGEFPPEGYKLVVMPESIKIYGSDRGGLLYAIETLLQLMPAEIYSGRLIEKSYNIACQEIEDSPYFEYRGVMLDVARSFSDKKTVLNFIERMAHHKLNRFHWHLTDDEGWRIEIEGLPELATVGGFRGGDSPILPIYGKWEHKYGGYFTKSDIREIVEYAAIRNIEIIPEIELPGHSRAVAKVYPEILCAGEVNTADSGDDSRNVWCVAKQENYTMLEQIIDEICNLFPSRYIHIGGDEVLLGQWRTCPDCKRLMRQEGYTDAKQLTDYFVVRVSQMLRDRGREAMVWDEAAESGVLDKRSRVSGWQGVKQGLEAAERGYKTVITAGNYFYFDMKQAPSEDGLTWAGVVELEHVYSFSAQRAGITSKVGENILGVEATFFSELLVSHTPDYLWLQVYPRISALAEVAWRDGSVREYEDFYYRLTKDHLQRLGAMGIKYRLFPPIVDYKEGVITAHKPFKGVEIRYTNDGSRPSNKSPLYDLPISDIEHNLYQFCTFFDGVGSPPVTPTAKVRHTIESQQTKTFEIPLSQITDQDGLWYFHIATPDGNMRLNRVDVRYGGEQQTIIGYPQNVNPMHKMRFYADAQNREGVMSFTIKNNNDYDCNLTFNYELSPYIEPKVKVTSSIGQNRRFPFTNVQDYNFSTYSRTSRTCNKGDYITFTFEQEVDAQRIDVATGLNYLPRFQIISGRVQISRDGELFEDAMPLIAGKATLRPTLPIKAIRIISDKDGNSENAVAIQDLKIKPRRR